MSLQQQVIDALVLVLKQIRTANGYQSEVGANVFLWRRHELSAEEVPCLLVQDTDLETEMILIGTMDNALTVDIIAVDAGDTSISQARLINADLVKCLEAVDLSSTVPGWLSLSREKSSLLMEQHEHGVAAVKLTAKLLYRTDPDQS